MELADRIKDISKRHGLSHIGSCLSVLPILEQIYQTKGKDDLVILDAAHSHLAHLVVREKYEKLEHIENILDKEGIHCDRKAGCDVSGGSLGHGIGIAIGLYLATGKRIHVIVTDGSLQEGSDWEALRIIHDMKLDQIGIYCNFNGYTAVQPYKSKWIEKRMKAFYGKVKFFHTKNGEGFDGVQGHYKVL